MAATTINEDLPYLDLSSEAFSATGHEIRAARAEGWAARTNYGLAVIRAEQIGALLKDRRLRQGLHTWPAQNGITKGVLAEWWSNVVVNHEGEDHKRLRRLVNPAFGPRVIEEKAPAFHRIADDLVDEFEAGGSCEFVSAFAAPYAAKALIEVLGLEEASWQQVSDWSGDITHAFGVNIGREKAKIEAALEALYDYTDDVISRRRENPGNDTISRLVSAHSEDEDHLSHGELRTMVSMLIFAGMDTTKNQVALAIKQFADYHDQWDLLRERPELAPAAVEEVMRVNSTVLWISREATESFVYEGVEITEGTTLHVFPESGGTDPLYVGGEGFDITADRPKHFGFGAGPHHCVGHFMARIDMREALVVLSERLRNPRLDGTPKQVPESGLWGPIELPIAFEPGRSA